MVRVPKGVAAYLVLTFGLAWVLWEIPIAAGIDITGASAGTALLPGGFAPALAAIVVRKWVTREGFADAGLRPNLHAWRYYLGALLLPYFVIGAIAAIAIALHLAMPDFALERGLHALGAVPEGEPVPERYSNTVPIQLAVVALIATPILWGEEFGWRGYLQRRLFAGDPLRAAVATGLIWGVWHYPLNLRGYNYPGHPYLGLIVFPVGTVMLSIIFGWLREKTGSIWAPSLAHAATNAMGGSLTVLLFAGSGDLILVGYLGLLGWVPLGALCAWIVLSGQLKAPSNPAGG